MDTSMELSSTPNNPKNIMKYIIDSWTSYNEDLHQQHTGLDRSTLTAQVQNLLHMASQDPALRAMTNSNTEANIILNRSTAQIHQWIETASLHI